MENLRKRKVVCISWCYLFTEAGKDVDHLLLHCTCSRECGGIYSGVLVFPG